MGSEHKFNHKHLISLADLSPQDLDLVLQTAESFREISSRSIKKVPTLRGRTVINLFFEPISVANVQIVLPFFMQN